MYINADMTSDGFAALFRALCNSPFESLDLRSCGLSSLEIDSDYIPANLAYLDLSKNNIGPDGCRGLATLLQKENSTLDTGSLDRNNKILANALRSNTGVIAETGE
mmetsp:Transcript_16423/g.27929  ORF Transcript_16423/g.27929 Transcript_16423/m.27929 type:complete len:106 (+) Transcript_16423:763-1080(+)